MFILIVLGKSCTGKTSLENYAVEQLGNEPYWYKERMGIS